MAQNIILKRSAVPGKVPDTGSLQVGELALNTYDGKAFIRQSGSLDKIVTLIAVDSNGVLNVTESLTLTGSLLGTASYANNLGGFDSTYFVDITSSQTIDGQKTILQPLSLGQYGATNGKLFFYGVDTGNKLSVEATGLGDLTFVDQTGSVLATLYQDGTGFELNAGNFRGNLTGTASFADTASVAISASYAPSTPSFPYTGSAQITGSLGVTGSSNFNGNVIITGSATNSLLVRGSGATSATNALLVQNSSGTSTLTVQDNGVLVLGSNGTVIYPSSTANRGVTVERQLGSAGGFAFRVFNNVANAAGEGMRLDLTYSTTVADSWNSILVNTTINQTGGANGITRGLFISPTLRSAPNWRSIEWNNNTGFGLYGSGSAQNAIRGNTTIGALTTGSSTLNVAGTTRLSGSFNTAISGTILTVIGSGSGAPVFTIQGSQGELFSVTDSLSGSLFSVNDISGLPIMEVFSDNTILMGDYQDPMLITTTKVTQTNSGSFVVYSLPTASYDTAFFEYSIKSGSNARAGTIMAIQSGTSVNFTETTTTDFGNTTPVSFTVVVTGSNMALTGSSTTGSWTIKTIIRSI